MGKIFFGLKKGQGLEKRVPHPLQEFPGVSPGKVGGEGGGGYFCRKSDGQLMGTNE